MTTLVGLDVMSVVGTDVAIGLDVGDVNEISTAAVTGEGVATS